MQSDELGHCIRAWRDRLEPAAAGLPAGAWRHPSRQVLAALAQALDLTDEERRHLYLVAMNELGTALVGDMSEFAGRDRNLAWRRFHGDHSRLRSDAAQKDARLAETIAELRRIPRFEEMWRERPVAVRGSDRKTIEHPEVAPDTPDAEALARLGELVLAGATG